MGSPQPEIPIGERRVTKWKKRVIVAVEHIHPNGPRNGKVRFYFEDEGPQPYDQRMSTRHWRSYRRAP